MKKLIFIFVSLIFFNGCTTEMPPLHEIERKDEQVLDKALNAWLSKKKITSKEEVIGQDHDFVRKVFGKPNKKYLPEKKGEVMDMFKPTEEWSTGIFYDEVWSYYFKYRENFSTSVSGSHSFYFNNGKVVHVN